MDISSRTLYASLAAYQPQGHGFQRTRSPQRLLDSSPKSRECNETGTPHSGDFYSGLPATLLPRRDESSPSFVANLSANTSTAAQYRSITKLGDVGGSGHEHHINPSKYNAMEEDRSGAQTYSKVYTPVWPRLNVKGIYRKV